MVYDSKLSYPLFDQKSVEYKFSWLVLDMEGSGRVCLPQLVRTLPDSTPVNLVSVKMLENVMVESPGRNQLPSNVAAMPEWFKVPVSLNESKLLSDINKNHCEGQFGQLEQFRDDYLVRTTDVIQYCHYLTFCRDRINRQDQDGDFKCGFLTVSERHEMAFVVVDGSPHIPLFYLQDKPDRQTWILVSGWEWAYLRFCCATQRISPEFLSGSGVLCVDLSELIKLLPVTSTFRTFWPSNGHFEPGKESDKYMGQLESIQDFQDVSMPVPSTEPYPYRIMEVPFSQKQIRCVNFYPHQFTLVMVPLTEFVKKLYPGHTENQVATVINSLRITIYRGNSHQREVLKTLGYQEAPSLISVIQLLSYSRAIQSKLLNLKS